jgi:hypothetical protein
MTGKWQLHLIVEGQIRWPFEQNACQLKPRKSIVREGRLMMLFAAGN